MRHANRIFTKKQLYEQVWEDEYCYDDNTLMVTVSRLRNKIEPHARNPEYIVLQRGLGYMFRREE
jgi:DNA-binding response OmpR family regulator